MNICTVGHLSVEPIEKNVVFFVTSVCARRPGVASQAFECMRSTLSHTSKTLAHGGIGSLSRHYLTALSCPNRYWHARCAIVSFPLMISTLFVHNGPNAAYFVPIIASVFPVLLTGPVYLIVCQHVINREELKSDIEVDAAELLLESYLAEIEVYVFSFHSCVNCDLSAMYVVFSFSLLPALLPYH